MKKVFILFVLSLCLFGCSSNEENKVEEKQNSEIIVEEKVLYKYYIDDVDYSILEPSTYSNSSANDSILFYNNDIGKKPVENMSCGITLKLDGEYYFPLDNDSCIYNKTDDGYTVDFNYKTNETSYGYAYGDMTFKIKTSENEKTYVFDFGDKQITANNSYYEKFKELGHTKVLFELETHDFYDLNGLSIYKECVDDSCEEYEYKQIDLSKYTIIDETNGTEDIIPSQNIELKYIDEGFNGDCYDAGFFSIQFYQDMTCEIDTTKVYHFENEFKDCKYTLNKDGDDYQADVSVEIYDDIDKIWEEYNVIFDLHINEENKIYKITTSSDDAVIVFQDYGNYERYIEMY